MSFRKIRYGVVTIITLLPLGFSPTAAVLGQATSVSSVIERLRAAIEYEMATADLPAFSIALVDDQETVWMDGFGFQDTERRLPATADTVFRVGSVSKLFTDIAVMQLVEREQLDPDAPVTRFLPGFRPRNPFGGEITLRQLMSHQAGLVRESPVGHYFDPEEPGLAATVASLNATTLVYAPGSRTKYSNAGIAVVGAVLEQALATSYDKTIEQTILNPLRMSDSAFVRTEETDRKLAAGWMWTCDGRRFEAPKFSLGTAPAGNMYSTVRDLSRFIRCLFRAGRINSDPADDQGILRPETLRLMMTPQRNSAGAIQDFGIGFHIQDLDGHQKIGHGGAVYGFSTQLEMLPDQKLGVAAIASLDGSNGLVSRLSDYALRLLLALQQNRALPDYPMTVPIPAERAADLVGEYRFQDRRASIEALHGTVTLQSGTFRHVLRARAKDGSLVTDGPTGGGTTVALNEDRNLVLGETTYKRLADLPPADAPDRWKGLIGEYGWDHNVLYILEDHGRLFALIEWFYAYPLEERSTNEFAFPDYGLYHGEKLIFDRDADGRAIQVTAAEVCFRRRRDGTEDGDTFRITPLKPIDELRETAMQAEPPAENGSFLESDMVELTSLDPTIRLDIRYSTTNNFTGAVFYQQPKAFMQRPAAEAVVRVHQRLNQQGLGLLIHDAYRPWHVTKMFWDATPDELKDFVANPERGSRHNRGCAVDLTLYDLQTGEPIQMVAGYDEFSPRSFPQYPGGTSRQRWYRHLLRRSMEAEGFSVYEYEWWHFDFRDWQLYRIGNRAFEQIAAP